MKLSALRWHWNTLGRQDPMHAILTRATEDPRWDLDAFFETGRRDIGALMTDAARLTPALQKRRALDFGCGIGRLTSALAEYFDEVVGVDIAESMIAAARKQHAHLARCRFELNVRSDLRDLPSERFDLVLAWIVLQHMPPPLMRRYIAEFVRVLAPGGLLVFQLPAEVEDSQEAFCDAPVVGGPLKQRIPRPMLRAYRRLNYQLYRRFVPHMEMYGMACELVVELVTSRGGQVLEVQPNQSHGPATPGYSYWVSKLSR